MDPGWLGRETGSREETGSFAWGLRGAGRAALCLFPCTAALAVLVEKQKGEGINYACLCSPTVEPKSLQSPERYPPAAPLRMTRVLKAGHKRPINEPP